MSESKYINVLYAHLGNFFKILFTKKNFFFVILVILICVFDVVTTIIDPI